MTIYPTVLYIKQHSVTKLKYFGKTTQDPYTYKGSGVDWILHLKEHGKKHVITTDVFGPYTDSIAISEFALIFSRYNDIVASDLWANQKLENGLDGNLKGTTRSDETKQKMSDAHKGIKLGPHSTEHRQKISDAKKGKTGRTHSDETKQKMSDAHKGRTHSDETKQKISNTQKGKPRSTETRQKQSAAATGRIYKLVTCPHCGKIGSNMKRWHFDNCKKNPSNLDHPVPAVLL